MLHRVSDESSSGAAAHETMYQNCMVAFQLAQSFLLKMEGTTGEEMEERYRQMLVEIMFQEFCGVRLYLTVWGTTPLQGLV